MKPNYMDEVLKSVNLLLKMKKGGGVYEVCVYHDDGCPIFKGKPCNCKVEVKTKEHK